MNNMKSKAKFIYFLGLGVCAFLRVSVTDGAEIDPYPSINIPIYKGGYGLQEYFDASQKTKSIHFCVQTGYPPTEVLEFYDAYFNGRGWQSSFEICQRNWEDFSKGTKAAGAPSRGLFASWEHLEFNLKALLWLTFEMDNKGRQNEVMVKCRLQPRR
jgi:hypothetical protein